MNRSISWPHLCGLVALITGPMLWPALATAASRYWDGAPSPPASWDTPASWSTASGATTPNPLFKPGAADTAIFNITTVNTAVTVNLDAAQSALGLVFNSSGSVLIQSGAGGPNTLTLGAGGITSNGGGTISSSISLAAPQTWLNDDKFTVSGNITNGTNLLTIDGTGATTISGVLGNGSGGLTKNGAGQLVLSNSNTFTGGVTINGGTLRIDNPGALNSATPNAVAFGAASTGVLSLNGNSLTLSSLSTNASVGTPIVRNASATPATLTLNGPGTFDFYGALQDGSGGGALSLVKSGTGTIFLGGNNTLTGGISVDAGALGVQAGALATIGSLAVGTGMAGSGTVNINGSGSTLTQSGSSTLTVGAASGAVGAINIGTTASGGALTTGTGLFTINKTGTVSVGSATTSGTLNMNGDVAINGVLQVNNAASTIVFGGSGPLNVGVSSDAATTGVLNFESGAHADIGNLAVGTGSAGTGTLSINGAALVQSGASTLTVGATSGGTGNINIGTSAVGSTLTTGTGLLTINKTGRVTIGNNGTGTLNVNGNITIDGGRLSRTAASTFAHAAGKTLTIQNGGGAFFSGDYSTAPNAVYNISGNLEYSNLGFQNLNIYNVAQMNVSNGGVISANTINVDGGVLQVSMLFVTGENGPPGFGAVVFTVKNGGRVTFDVDGDFVDNYNVSGGTTCSVTGTNSKWEFVDGTGLDIGSASTTLPAQVNVSLGGMLSVAGDVTVRGPGSHPDNEEVFGEPSRLTIDTGGTLTANALFVNLANGIVPGGVFNFINGTLGITGAAGLTLGPTNLGTYFAVGPNRTLNVTNATTIPAGAGLALNGGTLNTGSLVVNGAIDFNSGTLGITGPAGLTVGSSGPLGSTLFVADNLALHVTNSTTVNAGARLIVGGEFTAMQLLNNGDLIAIDSTVGGPVVNNNTVTVVGSVDFNGLVSGPGNFFGPGTAHFNGGMAPGASPANISFEGNLALADTNTLFIEIGGTTPGSQYDRLTIAGSATLDGMLNVSLVDLGGGTFTPTGGQQFTILTASNVINNGFVLSGSAASSFNLLVSSTSVILQAIGLPGDYNQNGIVDAADYLVWRKNSGTSTALPNDLIGGTIGTAQYNQWRANFGQSTPGSGSGSSAGANAAVPEPATLMFMSLAAAYGYLRRRRAANAHGR